MSMVPPGISPLSMGGFYGSFMERSQVQPFTYRAAITATEIQERLRRYVEGIAPQINGLFSELTTDIDSVVEEMNTSLGQVAQAHLAGQIGGIAVAPPTNNAVTDTASIKAAFSASATFGLDVHLSVAPSPDGIAPGINQYLINSPISFNVNRGSLYGHGLVQINASGIDTSTVGPAFTVSANNGLIRDNHRSAQNRISGFGLIGNSAATTLDGFKFTDIAIGLDMAGIEHVWVSGFRDNITFGNNVWALDFYKCAVSSAQRYGVNLSMGTNAGEAISFTHSSIMGAKGAAIWSGDSGNARADFKMIGGSLDYNACEGILTAGNYVFIGVHIEDNNTGAMFTYNQSLGKLNVAFRDCAWDSSATASRPYIHEILGTSGSAVTLLFDGDKGGVYPNTRSEWVHDDTSNRDTGDGAIQVDIRGFGVDGYLLLGLPASNVVNGDFSNSTMVAGPGTLGWFGSTYANGVWSIGPGGQPGGGLRINSTQVGNHYAQQMVPISQARSISMGGKIFVNSVTAGSASMTYTFYAADATTIMGTGRIGDVVSTNSTDWSIRRKKMMPPRGASFVAIKCNGEGFIGQATFDCVECVPV